VSPQRSVALGADRCSDDWCIAADSSHRNDDGVRTIYTVSLRVSSRARRIAQRERFVVAYLRDARGWRYDALPDPQAAPFDTLLQPGEAIRTVRRFVVPASATSVGLVIGREGGFNFPGCCIIGDENSVLHKRAVIRLDAAR